MTTVAWDGKIICSDSQTTVGMTREHTPAQKLWKRGNVVFAGAGAYGNLLLLGTWFMAGARWDEYPRIPKKADILFVIIEDGKLLEYDGSYPAVGFPQEPPYALGTGSQLALGAMSAGANAKKAVEIASRYDLQTDNRLQFFRT